MPFFKSFPENAGPPAVFKQYPELYGLWSEMSQVMMNGPSPLSQGERELILAFGAGVAGCKFVYAAHTPVATEWGIEDGLVEQLVDDFANAPVDAKLRPLLAFVRKLTLTPSAMTQADADSVLCRRLGRAGASRRDRGHRAYRLHAETGGRIWLHPADDGGRARACQKAR